MNTPCLSSGAYSCRHTELTDNVFGCFSCTFAIKMNVFVARTFVHEWGHFRFGIFDEYSTVGYAKFKIKNGIAEDVMKCAKYMRGSIVNMHGTVCDFSNPRNILFGLDTCSFREDSDPGVKASMMFRSYMPQVSALQAGSDKCKNYN